MAPKVVDAMVVICSVVMEEVEGIVASDVEGAGQESVQLAQLSY